MRPLVQFKNRLMLAFKLLAQPSISKTMLINNENLLRSRIETGLNKIVRPQHQDGINLHNQIIDSIFECISGLKSPQVRMNDLFNEEYFNQALREFAVIIEMCSYWESRVKLLAARLGIEIGRKQIEQDGTYKVLKFRDLSKITADIVSKCKGVDLNIEEIREVRNSIIHTNYQQLREDFNKFFPGKEDEHKGHVIVWDLTTDSHTNLSSNLPAEKITEQDIYGWFIEASNSHLFQNIMIELENSIKRVTMIIHLKAHSFDGRERLFEKLVFRGKNLSAAEEKEYIDYSNQLDLRAFNKEFFDDFKKIKK